MVQLTQRFKTSNFTIHCFYEHRADSYALNIHRKRSHTSVRKLQAALGQYALKEIFWKRLRSLGWVQCYACTLCTVCL